MNDYSYIIHIVQVHTRIDQALIMSRKRNAHIVKARALAMYLAYKLPHSTLASVGSYFDRDPTTIHHAIRKVERALLNNPEFAKGIATLINHATEYLEGCSDGPRAPPPTTRRRRVS